MTFSQDLTWRGLVHQISDPKLPARLDSESMTLYAGFDPSADSLHVGSLLLITNLRRYQLAGHRPIALAGGGTGLIGDPGGKESERELLDLERHRSNMAGIRAQMEQFLDFEPGKPTSALLLDNADWLCSIGVVDFLRDVGKHFTVNHMVTKESVRARLERPDRGISYTEFSYMLLQAYDFLHLFDNYGCRLQIGGSDQWGNIVEGVDLIRRVRATEAFALTSPLLLKADGTKMGKSEAGAVWLDPKRTSPYQMFQYFLQTEDAVVGDRLRMLTFLDHAEIEHLDEEVREHPERRAAQRGLARAVTTFVHGDDATARAGAAAQALFSEEVRDLDEEMLLEVLSDAPSSERARGDLDGEGLDLVAALAEAGLSPSRSAARTTIAQGGAYVNNRRRDDGAAITRDDLLHDRYVLLRRGRKDYHLLSFK
jgi:tyrosyl-tRNA synthetase